jgi:RNA polymerase sigma factor (sigma-70 family)
MAALRRILPDDAALAKAVADGDPDAFSRLDDRYRRPLARYARSLLRRSDHDAEDVVQDVLIRAHALLRDGRPPDELRPWLYRLVRNRAIDEVRRARWGISSLDDEAAGLRDPGGDVEATVMRRDDVRRLVEDLADLPERQRAALLARDVDGHSPEQVAGELGVSVPAAQMLASRARQSLVRQRAARDAECHDVRGALSDAYERGARPSEHVRRHVRGCSACRGHQRDLKRLSRRLHHAFVPPIIAFGPLAALAKLLGTGGGKATAGVAAAALLATGGVTVLATDVFSPGDPAPFRVLGIKALVGKSVAGGDRLPRDTAVVTARVHIAKGPADESRTVTLSCPAGMRVAGFASPQQKVPLSYGLDSRTPTFGAPTAKIVFSRQALARDTEATVGVVCRTPTSTGSLAANPRPTRRGEQAATVCALRAYLYQSPGRVFVGSVHRNQPVSIQRTSRSGRWVYVAPDVGTSGWMQKAALCDR